MKDRLILSLDHADKFKLICSITPGIAKSLMIIGSAKERIALLLVSPTVLALLGKIVKLYIDGQDLPSEVKDVPSLMRNLVSWSKEN